MSIGFTGSFNELIAILAITVVALTTVIAVIICVSTGLEHKRKIELRAMDIELAKQGLVPSDVYSDVPSTRKVATTHDPGTFCSTTTITNSVEDLQ